MVHFWIDMGRKLALIVNHELLKSYFPNAGLLNNKFLSYILQKIAPHVIF